MKVQIQIVTWNSERYIRKCLDSIVLLNPQPDSVVVVDNNSSDATKKIVALFSEVKLISQQRNTGFTGGHNTGFQFAPRDTEYILCVNPDVILFPNALEIFLSAHREQPDAGSIGGMLLKQQLTGSKKISIVDTAGIRRKKTFQFVEIQPFELEENPAQKTREVFANSGACLFLSTQTIEKLNKHVEENGRTIFDNRFFAYKEDIDLGFRIRSLGLLNYSTTHPVGTHMRTLKKEVSHSERTEQQILLSYRNHLLLLSKHLSKQLLTKYGLFIGAYEIGKFFYLLVTHPKTLMRAIHEYRILKRQA